MSIDQYDSLAIRCPRIGGDVIFKFCRSCDQPFCHRIIVCWAITIDIGTYLAQNFTPQQIHSGLERKPRDKLSQLLNLAQKSKS